MKAPYLALLINAALVLSAGAIDLVPRYVSTMNDGVVSQRPYFADGEKKYAVKIDSETKLTEFEGGASFRFDKFPGAMLRLRQSPIPAQIAFAPESLDRYQQAARALLSTGAEEIALLEGTPNPLPINNWQSYRFTFSYRIAGETRRQSVTFLDLKPTEQIVIQTASSERDFDEISERAFNIIRRWHEVVPADEMPFN